MISKPAAQDIQLEFEAIGTHWRINLNAPAVDAPRISAIITRRIKQFDASYSRFRPDSWLVFVGNNPGKHQVPTDFEPIFKLYQNLYKLTDGAVTPLIGDAMERAGYDANYSLVTQPLVAIPDFAEALQLKDNTLHVKYKCVIDVGAAGKGYLVDLVSAELSKQGISSFTIDAGGDIYTTSPTPLAIGLEDPSDTSKVIGTAILQHNRAICGSASNRRRWGDMHHIMNPHTLKPVSDVAATWVVAGSTMVADGLSTALFFTEPQQLSKDFNFEYVVLKADNSTMVSKNFAGEIFDETNR